MHIARAAFVLAVIAVALAAYPFIGGRGPEGGEPRVGYVPGLGEIMTAIQMRHAKLGIAGAAGNWELVDYEIDELEEGLQDAVTLHPNHDRVPQPLTQLVPTYTEGPINDLRVALKSKDAAKFEVAFDMLTAGCNGCHEAANFKFNRVTKPTAPPVSNQDFHPIADEAK